MIVTYFFIFVNCYKVIVFLHFLHIDFYLKKCYYEFMDIKAILKYNQINLSKFSEILKISRPTLNNYISDFETSKCIPNKFYDRIFKELFNTSLSIIEFHQTINKWENIISNNLKEDTHFSNENIELMEAIIKKMKDDMKGKKEPLLLYKFINSILYTYNVDNILTGYINYILYLNSLKDISTMNENEKILISNIFSIMNKYSSSTLTYNEDGFESFLKRVKIIQEEKNNFLNNRVMKEIELVLRKKLDLVLKPEEINLSELLLKIKEI